MCCCRMRWVIVDADGHNPLHYAAILGTDMALLQLHDYMEDAVTLERKAAGKEGKDAQLPGVLKVADRKSVV